jgi:hypothetical protein
MGRRNRSKFCNLSNTRKKESLNYWFNYLLSPEAENYPLEFRYWAFIEMLKCGSYDEKRRTFNERTKSTIAPFPPLNQQALAIVLDEIIRRQNKEPSQILASLQDENERKEFEKRLQAENFRDLYGFALDYVKRLVLPEERLPIIKGEWRVFKKGSDPKELVKAIQNFPTGWCIAGEGTAASYLSHSDIWIYFSEDIEGNPTIPRAAIVYNPELQRITEISGIAESQNLDPYIHPVVEEKLREIPQGIEWMETMQDQKKLAEIYLKHLNNQELTQEELRFIYEIDRGIKIFGYGTDPRIEKILRNRNGRKDLSIILNCQENEIATNKDEITDNTTVIYMPGKILRLEKLPPNLEYAFCSLNLRNTIIKSLGKLKKVGMNLDLLSSQIEDLGDLEEVGMDLDLTDTPIKSLGKLKRVGGHLYLSYSQIEDLGDLEEVGKHLYLTDTPIKSLGKLKRVGWYLNLSGSQIEDLGDLEEVGMDLDLTDTPIKSLGKLKRVGGDLYLSGLQIEDLGDLEEVEGHIYISRGQKNLEEILIKKGWGGKIRYVD